MTLLQLLKVTRQHPVELLQSPTEHDAEVSACQREQIKGSAVRLPFFTWVIETRSVSPGSARSQKTTGLFPVRHTPCHNVCEVNTQSNTYCIMRPWNAHVGRAAKCTCPL